MGCKGMDCLLDTIQMYYVRDVSFPSMFAHFAGEPGTRAASIYDQLIS